ncbi:MAG: N-acetyltransferase family protein [Planctomycetota bacterium]
MTQLHLRRATEADAAGVLAIYGPAVRDTAISFEEVAPSEAELAARITTVGGQFPWLIAERDGQVAGYAYAGAFRARAAYRWTVESSVYVHADHRRAGVARRLMEALIDVLRALGYRTLVAGATMPNDVSVRLHEALGFTLVGTFPNVGHKHGGWHGVRFWTLDLGELQRDAPPRPIDALEDLALRLARHAAPTASITARDAGGQGRTSST